MGVKNFLRFSLVTFTNSSMQISIRNVLSSPHSFLTYMLHVFFQYSTTMTPFNMRTKVRTSIHLSSHFHILWFAVWTNSNNKFSTRFFGNNRKECAIELMVEELLLSTSAIEISLGLLIKGENVFAVEVEGKFSSIFSASHMVEITNKF